MKSFFEHLADKVVKISKAILLFKLQYLFCPSCSISCTYTIEVLNLSVVCCLFYKLLNMVSICCLYDPLFNLKILSYIFEEELITVYMFSHHLLLPPTKFSPLTSNFLLWSKLSTIKSFHLVLTNIYANKLFLYSLSS